MNAAGNSRAVEPLAVEGRRVRLRDWRADDLPVYERWIMPPPGGGEHDRVELAGVDLPEGVGLGEHVGAVTGSGPQLGEHGLGVLVAGPDPFEVEDGQPAQAPCMCR